VGEIIQNDIISLEVDKINFDDKESVKSLIITLLNVVEQLLQENRQLRVELQQSRDENARLKGEKGKPKIAPNVPPRKPQLPPAEKSKKWSKDSKKPKIKIDRVVSLKINPETLSPDAVFKGYSSIVIQNIRLQTDNVEYRREHYYSPSLNKNYYADSLFTRTTGYIELDKRIASTFKNRKELLTVLESPAVPLHNNGSEIAVREGVLKRKISYGTRSDLGKAAWENMLSIRDTCRKLKVGFFEYVRDIYSNDFCMPILADLLAKAE
jgi:hypothetical protein